MDIPRNKRPRSAYDYFIYLYCERKKRATHREAARSWQTLTNEEKQVIKGKYKKWKAEHDTVDNRLANILQHAEPFLKKRKNNKNLSVVNRETETRDDIIQPMIYSPQDSNADLELTSQVYAASVIDTDINETTTPQEINVTIESEKLTEPTPPSLANGKELFEALKCSGSRPELATIEWMQLLPSEKTKYQSAVTTMRREYLLKYEQYLESLSSPDLFKHYIKTLNQ